jgi:hypothetical protein
VFFLYSAAVRENSLPALIPLIIFLIYSQFEKMKIFWIVLLACGVSVFSLFIVHFFNYGILQTKKTFPYQISQIFDVAGVFVVTGREDLIPTYWKKLNPEVSPETLMSKYDPNSVISLVFWGDSLIKLTSEPSYLKELNEKWLEAVFHNPWAFLQHRWKAFKPLMGIGMPKTYYPYHFGIERYTRGIQDQGDPMLQQVFKTYVVFFRDSFFFRGWVYLVLLFSLALYQFLKYPATSLLHQPGFCAGLSGLLYGLGYFLYTPAADFRFLYPTVLLFFLSLILTVSEVTQTVEKSFRDEIRDFMGEGKKKVKIRG